MNYKINLEKRFFPDKPKKVAKSQVRHDKNKKKKGKKGTANEQYLNGYKLNTTNQTETYEMKHQTDEDIEEMICKTTLP